MNGKMTGAQAVTECLNLEKIHHVFCVPGESYLALIDTLYDTDIQLISARHEGGAVFMAEAYAKATGKPGVAMATRAVGAANLAIGVHTAFQDSTPLVVILGQVNRTFRGREGFQEVDLDQLFSHIAKWAVEISDVERIPEIVQRAFRMAKTGRPGPVVISIPEDVMLEEAFMRFGPISGIPKPRPSTKEVKEVVALLKKAKRPLILAGGGVKSANAENNLIAFAEQCSIPVMSAFRRQDVFPNNHPLYVGHAGLGTFSNILETIKEADTIIAVGTRFSEVTTQDYTILNHQPKLIHVDIDYATLGKVYSPDVGIIADAKEALRLFVRMKLDDHLKTEWKLWAGRRREIYEQATARLNGINVETSKIDLQRVIGTLQDLLPHDAIITNDAGNFAGWMHQFYQFNHSKTYIGPTSGAMGYGLPAAIGAKLACPDQTVVSLSGDGGFMMTMQELETAVRYQIPIISLVFNNQMYGTIRMHQERMYPERVMGTSLSDVDFASLAKTLKVNSYLVTTNQEFEMALSDALLHKVPSLIEIKTDPEQISVQHTISGIRQKAFGTNLSNI